MPETARWDCGFRVPKKEIVIHSVTEQVFTHYPSLIQESLSPEFLILTELATF